MALDLAARAGMRLGPYEIGRLLGQGGMASVHEARHVALDKRVAVKVMHPHIARTSTAAARFLREGRAASKVVHPNVVEVFELGEQDEVPYLAMELLDGEDLGTAVARRGRIEPTELVDLMLPVLSAVHAAHLAGVVHRDLKPSNVLLSRDRWGAVQPKVVDFGISKIDAGEEGQPITATEAVLGTFDYMSPEQTRSARETGPLSDQYSIGVMLYECATGRRPFAAESAYELMHAILTAPVADPCELEPTLPAEMGRAILRAMHRKPERRFPSVLALAARLLPFASDVARAKWSAELEPAVSDDPSHETIEVLPPPGPGGTLAEVSPTTTTVADGPRIGRRTSRALVAAAVALVAGIAAGAAMVAQSSERPALLLRAGHLVRASSAVAGSGNGVHQDVAPAVDRSTPTVEPAAPAPPASARGEAKPRPAREPRRTEPAATAAPPPSAAPTAGAPPRPAVGDNGAPILD